MEIRLVYITAGSPEEAREIGRDLVARRLAACVNIIAGMRAIYQWEGRLQEDDETVLIAKTTADGLDRLISRVREIHSYDCPCVLALPAAGGNSAFLEWIASQVD